MLQDWLLKILACPICKGGIDLRQESSRLVCRECGRKYPINDGIPMMRPDDAELPEGETQEREQTEA